MNQGYVDRGSPSRQARKKLVRNLAFLGHRGTRASVDPDHYWADDEVEDNQQSNLRHAKGPSYMLPREGCTTVERRGPYEEDVPERTPSPSMETGSDSDCDDFTVKMSNESPRKERSCDYPAASLEHDQITQPLPWRSPQRPPFRLPQTAANTRSLANPKLLVSLTLSQNVQAVGAKGEESDNDTLPTESTDTEDESTDCNDTSFLLTDNDISFSTVTDTEDESMECHNGSFRLKTRRIRFADEEGLPIQTVHVTERFEEEEDPLWMTVIILLMSPKNKKFEFIHVSYNITERTSLSSLLKQFSGMATDPALAKQRYVGLCRPLRDSQELINSLSIQDYDMERDEIMVALLARIPTKEILILSQALLSNYKVIKAVRRKKRNGFAVRKVKQIPPEGEEPNSATEDDSEEPNQASEVDVEEQDSEPGNKQEVPNSKTKKDGEVRNSETSTEVEELNPETTDEIIESSDHSEPKSDCVKCLSEMIDEVRDTDDSTPELDDVAPGIIEPFVPDNEKAKAMLVRILNTGVFVAVGFLYAMHTLSLLP